jgi:Tol biopolymer transport system component/predicted Ser/Thr protein kinase
MNTRRVIAKSSPRFVMYDSHSMPLAANTRLGPYEIIAPLGAGGMGEVFRARDTRLDRTVAIKICKGHFTERFEREARAISSLNHPHICALYDIGREGGVEFLVMEFIEGESLEARLRKGPLPIEEALQIAIQIASALNAAHRSGMVHRDLKPGNVMLTKSGAKLLDFGLAKMNAPAGLSDTDVTQLAPHRPITVEGTIVGTLQYMSPEQLEGKEADARSDVFSFGAMLYEMITGRKGFAGSSQATLIVAVMSVNPPPVSTLQPMASPALDRLVRKCLAKLPDDRWQNAGDLLSELEWIAETGSEAGVSAPVAAKRRGRERLAWLAAGVAAVLLIGLAVWIAIHLRNEAGPPATVQFEIPVPEKLSFYYSELPAVSPDGHSIAFTASDSGPGGTQRLFVRPLNAAAAREIPIPGSSPAFPFWSPDGQQIAFSSLGTLQRVDLSGGPPVTICDFGSLGGTWNRDGVILASKISTGVLFRVSQAGGDAKQLRPLAQGETAQRWPEFLPDGQHYLYLSLGNAPYQQGIYAASLDSNDRTFLVATNTNAAWLQSGQLLFTRGSVLMAQSFDLQSLKLSGEPRPVADHIETGTTMGLPLASFAASPGGVLVWRHGKPASLSSLQWFDRNGKKLAIVGEPADYSNPSLSPDDSKLAVCIRDPQTGTRDIWIFDLVRGGKTRLTFDPADDIDPIWSPDGTRIAFTSDRSGQRNIYWKLADGSGPEELLAGGKEGQENVEDWSRDGKYLIYNYILGHTTLHVLPLAGDRKPVTYLDTGFSTQESQFSPDGRWVAYYSNESGRMEVYVQGFSLDPSQSRGKWQVSTAGGELPRWRRDGKELYYHFGTQYFAVDVKTDGPSFVAGIPKPLFEAHAVGTTGISGSPYVVSSDGKRFLVLAATDEKPPSSPIDVVVNWR